MGASKGGRGGGGGRRAAVTRGPDVDKHLREPSLAPATTTTTCPKRHAIYTNTDMCIPCFTCR